MSSWGTDSGSADQQGCSSSRTGKKTYHRHTPQQIQQLETFFMYCPHPDDNQRSQLGREIGLEASQVKFWFQNKRTHLKTQSEHADNATLKAENESIRVENLVIRDALENMLCDSCRGAPLGEEEHYRCLQSLKLENARLREEHEKLSVFVEGRVQKMALLNPFMISATGSPLDFPSGSSITETSAVSDPFSGPTSSTGTMLHHRIEGITAVENAQMREISAGAMGELVRLLQSNKPFWMKSSSDGFILNRDRYDRIFPRNHFKIPGARVESSKDSGTVSMNAIQLVDMLLDSDKWMDLFPTIVTKAKTLHVVENGLIGSRSGALQLMHQQMHSLSPLVPIREFYVLRHCQQIEMGTWVIVDVSCDCFKENYCTPWSWRFPSGCMIHQISNSSSEVTWVEHVEVDDETQVHQLFRDLVCSNVGYGAQRWIAALQRMCKRLMSASNRIPSSHEFLRGEGRRRLMKLSHRMVKNFCGVLSMPGKLNWTQLSEVKNNEVIFSIRENKERGYPDGLIISAATSLRIPLPSENVFDFLRDEKTRYQWDILTDGNPVLEILNVANGIHPGNCISIIQPFVPFEQGMVVLQETCADPLASMIIYAPIDVSLIKVAVKHNDSSSIPILASGLVVSSDGHHESSTRASTSSNAGCGGGGGGSLLTVFFQVLATNLTHPKQLNAEAILTVNALATGTVKKIKAALQLQCCEVDQISSMYQSFA